VTLTSGALLLTLCASVAWAGFDATRKQLTRTEGVGALALAALLSLGQLPLFLGWLALAPGAAAPGAAYVPEALGAIGFNLWGTLLFLRAVRASPLSHTIPFLSFSPVFSVLLSALLLAELPGPLQLTGVALIVLGAFLLNLAPEDLAHPALLLRGLTRERGSLLMLGTALLWALGAIFDKRALRHAPAPVHAVVVALGIGLALLLALASRRELAQLLPLRRRPGLLLLALAFAAAAQALQLLALPLLLVSLFEALKRCIGMALALLNGAWMFGEPVTGRKLAATALMGAGVVLVLA
jgi:drug/metabolite transporter (DMT)-like permease